MKKRFACTVVLAASVLLQSYALRADAERTKVLIIGSSFARSTMFELPNCAEAAGITLDIADLIIGGCLLYEHWTNACTAATNANHKPYVLTSSYKSGDPDLRGRLGQHVNAQDALTNDVWDVVMLHQSAAKSPFYDTYEPYLGYMVNLVTNLAPQARLVTQRSWSYAMYDSFYTKNGFETQQEVYDLIKAAYDRISADYNLYIIPTGDAVQLYRRRLPVDYSDGIASTKSMKKPTVIDYRGDLDGKSYWKVEDGVEKLDADSKHFNSEGNYIQGCVWLGRLFGKDKLAGLTYVPDGVPPAKAKLMRLCAMDAILALEAEEAGE